MDELLNISSDSLFRFLVRWYGRPDMDYQATEFDDAIPTPLQEWHSTVSRWEKIVWAMNRPISPHEITAMDGKQVFWIENQGGQAWAYERGLDDPPVFQCDPSEEKSSWQEVGENLSRFLLHVTVYEALWNSRYLARSSSVASEDLERIMELCLEPGFPQWHWPTSSSRLLVSAYTEAIVGFSKNDENASNATFYVMVSANARAEMTPLIQAETDWRMRRNW